MIAVDTRIGSRVVTGVADMVVYEHTMHQKVLMLCDCGSHSAVFAHSLKGPKAVMMCRSCSVAAGNRARAKASRP